MAILAPALAILAVVVMVIMITLLALSVQDVSDNQVAIPYDQVDREIGDILEGGQHLLTPATKLFKYDSKIVSNSLSFPCFSKDGLEIDLRVVQQYRIKKDEVKTILFSFGGQDHLDDFIESVTRAATREACALFRGEQFFAQRNDIEAAIIANVTSAIMSVDAHVEPGFVQLFAVFLPSQFEDAIEAKQLAIEGIVVAENERAQLITERETERAEAVLQAQIVLNAANATAGGIIVEAQQRAAGRQTQWAQRAEAFVLSMDALGLDAEQYVDNYLLPLLLAGTLSAEQQACLSVCNSTANDCWYCFTNALPAVSI